MFRKSKLPAPPSNKGGRPLPPEPTAGGPGEAPPPLPSRGHGKPPPPGPSSMRAPPPVSDESSESSDDEGQTYEEPDLPPQSRQPPPPEPPQSRQPPPPEPPQSRHPPPPEPFEAETYDDLEDMVPEHLMDDEPGETYDECDLKPVPQQQQQQQQQQTQQQQAYEEDQLYEEEPPSNDFPPPVEDTDCLYEFMPENESPPPPAAPAAPAIPTSRPHIPSPPAPTIAPGLPARPPPSKLVNKDLSSDPVPDLPPGRPAHSQPGAKPMNSYQKMSGERPQMLGISLEQIGLKRAGLKKVSSEESTAPEPLEAEPAEQSAVDTNSVKARINLFKQAEKGVKPALSSKPFLPVKPSVVTKPVEVKSPVTHVKSPPPPVIKQTTPEPPPSFFESDDIYDEGFSYVPDALSREEWYHGELERAETSNKLHSIGQDGTFLVRKSKQGGDSQPYTLVVLFQGHVYNLKMRCRNDGQVALGEEKSDELTFKDVPSLIQHHRSHDVILVNVKEKKQHKTILKKHPIAIAS